MTNNNENPNWIFVHKELIKINDESGDPINQYFVASTWRRLFAFLIDKFILFFLIVPLFFTQIIEIRNVGFTFIPWIKVFSVFLTWFLYNVIFLRISAATIGKLMCGLKIISINDKKKKLLWLQAIIRVLSDGLSIFFSWAPQSYALLRKDRRQLADILAETQVVQFIPRSVSPKERLIIASFLIIYFVSNGIMSNMKYIQNIDVHRKGITYYKKW